MSDPRTPHQNGAAPWGEPAPQQSSQPHPEQLGSPAHPQSPYAEPQYPEHYAGASTGQHAALHTPVSGQQRIPVDGAYPPARRRTPSKPLPEPPAGLAVGAVVAACCLLFVELAESRHPALHRRPERDRTRVLGSSGSTRTATP